MSKLLEVRNLKKHFPIKKGILRRHVGNIRAVDGISFDLFPKDTVGLVGESGSGKSTAAWASMRLIEPTSGTVLFQGEDISQYKGQKLRHFRGQAQIIFQDPLSSLNPRKTILDNIGEALLYHRKVKTRKEQIESVAIILQQIGLPTSALGQYPHQFSGGQQQRISIGRAVAMNPKFIVCDEAVSALDVSVKGQILNLLEEFKECYQLSYLFISHDLNLVRFFCNYILVMYRGKIIERGPAERVFEDCRHPYTQTLINSIPRKHPGEMKHCNPALRTVAQDSVILGCPFFSRCPVSKPQCAHEEPPTKMDSSGHHYQCIH